ncbi:MAG: hypothetical protein ABIV48_06125, partial [Pyrinomonadaceae bacterium]
MNKTQITYLSLLLLFTVFVFAADGQTRTKRIRAKSTAVTPPPEATLPSFAIKTLSGLTYLVTNAGNGQRPKAGDTV